MRFFVVSANHSQYGAPMTGTPARLTELPRSASSRILGFAGDRDTEIRLREIGFAEGDSVTPLHFGLFGRNPMSVRVNGAIIALRREDAASVLVEAAE